MAFLDWVPPYYRSIPTREGHREVVWEMEEEDAVAAWILAVRLLEEGAGGPRGGRGGGRRPAVGGARC